MNVLQRIRYVVFPSGSRRERLGRFCAHRVRRARYRLQQALRTTGTAVRRALPPGLRAPQDRNRLHNTAGLSEVPSGFVTVVLPVYNQAGLLPGAIESVLGQTYPHFELLILDDGSTDDIAPVLARYARHPKVRILRQSNQTLPKALTSGFEFATGEFCTWTSADNLMAAAQLEREVDFLRRHPDAAMVYANYVAIDDRGAPLRDPLFRPQDRRTPTSPEILLPHDPSVLNTVEDNFIGPCFLYREWAGRLVGEYRPEMGLEDYDYWMRMNALVRIAHLDSDDCLYQYRVHDNSISARAEPLRIYERVRCLMDHERQRQKWLARPWHLIVDTHTRDWLSQVRPSGCSVCELGSPEAQALPSENRLVLIHARSLARKDRLPLPPHDCLTVWFGDDPAEPYRQRHALSEEVDACFAAETAVAARLRLFHRNVFHLPPGPALLEMAVAFAKSHGYYHATVSPAQRARVLPEPYQAPGHRPRILLQVGNFLQGGFEQVVLDVAATVRQAGMEPLLLVLERRGHAVELARQAGLPVLSLPDRHGRCYREFLQEHRIDLINAHYSWFGAHTARELGIPWVQTIHTSYVFLSPQEVGKWQAADSATNAYVCTSGNAALYADLRLGLDVEKMLIIANGVDLERAQMSDRLGTRARLRQELGLDQEDFVFLNVGSIYRDKGQKLAVAALAEVRKEYPRAKLVLLGRVMEDGYYDELIELIERRALRDAVRFAEYTDDVAPSYAMADAFVLPSFWEGWSLALAEALIAGLPIVATDVGAAREVLPSVGAQLVAPPYDSIADVHWENLGDIVRGEHPRLVAELAEAMRRVCADPVRPTLSSAARAALDRRNAYRNYVRLFWWLMQGGSARAARAWTMLGQSGTVAAGGTAEAETSNR